MPKGWFGWFLFWLLAVCATGYQNRHFVTDGDALGWVMTILIVAIVLLVVFLIGVALKRLISMGLTRLRAGHKPHEPRPQSDHGQGADGQ